MRPVYLSWVGLAMVLTLCSEAAAQPASQPTRRGDPLASQPAPGDDLGSIEAALKADRAATADAKKTAPLPIIGGLARAVRSMNPDLSLVADVALAAFSDDAPLMAGGHDPKESGFTLQQVELSLSASVDPYFRLDANIVFSQFGVEIEEVYATTLALPWNLQVRAGQLLTRFGRINATHLHAWDFVDQTLVLGKFFGGEGNRGLGAEVSVMLPLPWFVELSAAVTDAAGASTARSFYGGSDDAGVEGPQDFQYTAAAKQFFPLSQNWSLFVGLSWATGPNATGQGNRTDIHGADLYLKYRPITWGSYTVVSLQGEWMMRRRQVPGDVLVDHGMYTYLFWRFARRWGTAARYELVTGLKKDPLDPAWTETRQRLSTNVTFWPTEFSRLRLQYAYDLPGWRSGYHAVMLAVEFSVGAHGAHKF